MRDDITPRPVPRRQLKFIQLNLANDVLSDPIKKQQYDVGGSFSELSGGAKRKGSGGVGGGGGGGGAGGARRGGGFHNTHDERGRSFGEDPRTRGR